MKEGEQERAKEELKEEAHKLEEEKQTYQVETEKLSDELGPLRERVRKKDSSDLSDALSQNYAICKAFAS